MRYHADAGDGTPLIRTRRPLRLPLRAGCLQGDSIGLELFCFPGAGRRSYNRAIARIRDTDTGEQAMNHRNLALALALAGLWAGTALLQASAAGEGGTKKDEAPKLALWPDGAPGALGNNPEDKPTVTVYLPAADKATGAAIVICPGGGYGHLAMDHEGHQVARWLNSFGVAGIILQYRIAPNYHHPAPMQDAQRAIRYVRAHAKEWKIDPQKVGILGFSAGGHLASTAATHFDKGDANAKDPIDRLSSRPDFAVLVYPVITLVGPNAHVGSRNNLLGKNPDPKLVESLCNEKQVTPDTPPTFLTHTKADKGVPAENSVMFYEACKKNQVPAELHLFDEGKHGLGLGPKNLEFSMWPSRCEQWLRAIKMIGEKSQ
jgi:acetyl esterase/lipase